MQARATKLYRRVSIESAPKPQVLDELFSRFLSDCAVARCALEISDMAGKSAAVDHALRIVTELQVALDPTVSAELAGNLAALYQFVVGQLLAFSSSRDRTPLSHAENVMRTLRDAFRQVSASAEP